MQNWSRRNLDGSDSSSHIYLRTNLVLVFIPRETRRYRFQLFRLSVCLGSCPGYISERWKVFKFHIRIEHQWKVCNVVFSFDLMKNCENDRIWNLWNLRKYSTPCPGCITKSIQWSVIIHPYTDKAHIEGVQRRVLDQIN